ncbi:MAG: phosphonate ABC transporter, permease protein PhnE [Erysipelotrichaceae bacterium]|nr:phosphonate ABC transporter, permease protein PhnE [Erysipelotrichaceae bacterium]
MSTKKITVAQQLKNEPTVWFKVIISLIILAVIIYGGIQSMEIRSVNQKGLQIAINIMKGIFQPSMRLITDLSKNGLAYMLLETIAIAFLGTIFGMILALPLAFISSRTITPKLVNRSGLLLISIIRAFPSFMYGIMFIKVTGPGPFAGVLTMSVTSIGMLAKLMIEAIEDLDRGIIEALDAAGCNTIQKIRYGIIPQLSSNIISIVIYRFDVNIKQASILGIVGAGGIGASLIFAISGMRWKEVGAMLVGLIVVVLFFEYFSSKIRSKLATGE